nr:hypothetical protein CFP56_65933 [Quercus suber]
MWRYFCLRLDMYGMRASENGLKIGASNADALVTIKGTDTVLMIYGHLVHNVDAASMLPAMFRSVSERHEHRR